MLVSADPDRVNVVCARQLGAPPVIRGGAGD
jgi:hypothetical protein